MGKRLIISEIENSYSSSDEDLKDFLFDADDIALLSDTNNKRTRIIAVVDNDKIDKQKLDMLSKMDII